MGSNVDFSLAERGHEPGPELGSAADDELRWLAPEQYTPELLAQLHGRSERVKHPSAYEVQQHALHQRLLELTEEQFQHEYF